MIDRNYLIIGGSHGIGLEIVRKLLEDGHNVHAMSRTIGNLEVSPQLVHHEFNVLQDTISLNELPPEIHGLVYCPGSITLKPFNRLSDEDFLSDFQINLMGAFKTIKSVLPRLKQAKTGASVVMFSTVAVQIGMPFHSSIAAAKGAVEGLVRSMAAEFAPRIRVNAVAPSITDTPLAERLLSSDEKVNMSANRHPLKRIGQPADIADAAVYLLRDESGWMSGEILHVDGGMTSLRTF